MLMRNVLVAMVSVMLAAGLALAADPKEKPDDSWITVSGTVTTPTDDSFLLDYGEGLITVEMDDWDWYPEGKALLDGDKVTVYGVVDDDTYETRTIEAGSVYVENLNTYFYASAMDEEDLVYVSYTTPIVVDWMSVTGTVTSKDGREFTIDTGDRQLQVDTILMPYNPLDDKGFQKVKVGDRVRVSGEMDYDVWEEREIMADSIVTLSKNSK